MDKNWNFLTKIGDFGEIWCCFGAILLFFLFFYLFLPLKNNGKIGAAKNLRKI